MSLALQCRFDAVRPQTGVAFLRHRPIKRSRRRVHRGAVKYHCRLQGLVLLSLCLQGIVVHANTLEILAHRPRGVKNALLVACFCNQHQRMLYILPGEKGQVPFLELAESPHAHHGTSYFMRSRMALAIALAIRGGTALPTRVYCGISFCRLLPPVWRFP